MRMGDSSSSFLKTLSFKKRVSVVLRYTTNYNKRKRKMFTRSVSYLRKLSEEAVVVWREIQVLRESVNSSDTSMYLLEENTIQSTLHDMRVELYCLRQMNSTEEEDLGSLIKKSLRYALESEKRVSSLLKSPDLEELD